MNEHARTAEDFCHLELFAGVAPNVLRELLQESQACSLASGEFFIFEGDPAHSLFVLVRGQVAVLKSWEGKQFVMDHMQPGACFGEVGLLNLSPRTASVLAVEPAAAIEISSLTLSGLLSRHPAQSAIIQTNMARMVSRRFTQASDRYFRSRLRTGRAQGVP